MAEFHSGVALRAIAEFQCLGSDCELTCCSGWRIPLSKKDLEALEEAVTFSAEARATFDGVVKRGVELPVLGTCGELSMGPDGLCAFLDENQLCSVHTARGHSAIPTVCALYPRRFAAVGGRLEMTPLVSCPEAARQLLLRPDGIELVDLDPKLHPRIIANHVVAQDPAEPYERYMDDVRATILGVVERREVPLGVRLFFIATFAQAVDAFFARGRSGFDETGLAAALGEISDDTKLARLWDDYDEAQVPPLFGASIAYRLLAPLASKSSKLSTLFARALETFGSEDRLADAYAARSEFFESHLGDKLDLAFSNLTANFWMQSYLDSDSLFGGVRRLAVQIQVLRLLVLGDPELDAARIGFEAGQVTASDLSVALDQALVRVVFQFARGTEHDPDFWPLVQGSLDEAGHTSFAHIVGLLPRFGSAPEPAI